MVKDRSNLTRRPYKDIEGEMEDYERIYETEHESETARGEFETPAIQDAAYG